MTFDEFWKQMESVSSSKDMEANLDVLEQQLVKQPLEDIIDFQTRFQRLLEQSYSFELWGAAYVINGGCSDDGFGYFRAWLIGKGRKAYESALDNPDSLADVVQEDEEIDLECLDYVADKAYESKTGREMPDITRGDVPELGDDWDFDDDEEMKKRYPRLFAIY